MTNIPRIYVTMGSSYSRLDKEIEEFFKTIENDISRIFFWPESLGQKWAREFEAAVSNFFNNLLDGLKTSIAPKGTSKKCIEESTFGHILEYDLKTAFEDTWDTFATLSYLALYAVGALCVIFGIWNVVSSGYFGSTGGWKGVLWELIFSRATIEIAAALVFFWGGYEFQVMSKEKPGPLCPPPKPKPIIPIPINVIPIPPPEAQTVTEYISSLSVPSSWITHYPTATATPIRDSAGVYCDMLLFSNPVNDWLVEWQVPWEGLYMMQANSVQQSAYQWRYSQHLGTLCSIPFAPYASCSDTFPVAFTQATPTTRVLMFTLSNSGAWGDAPLIVQQINQLSVIWYVCYLPDLGQVWLCAGYYDALAQSMAFSGWIQMTQTNGVQAVPTYAATDLNGYVTIAFHHNSYLIWFGPSSTLSTAPNFVLPTMILTTYTSPSPPSNYKVLANGVGVIVPIAGSKISEGLSFAFPYTGSGSPLTNFEIANFITMQGVAALGGNGVGQGQTFSMPPNYLIVGTYIALYALGQIEASVQQLALGKLNLQGSQTMASYVRACFLRGNISQNGWGPVVQPHVGALALLPALQDLTTTQVINPPDGSAYPFFTSQWWTIPSMGPNYVSYFSAITVQSLEEYFNQYWGTDATINDLQNNENGFMIACQCAMITIVDGKYITKDGVRKDDYREWDYTRPTPNLQGQNEPTTEAPATGSLTFPLLPAAPTSGAPPGTFFQYLSPAAMDVISCRMFVKTMHNIPGDWDTNRTGAFASFIVLEWTDSEGNVLCTETNGAGVTSFQTGSFSGFQNPFSTGWPSSDFWHNGDFKNKPKGPSYDVGLGGFTLCNGQIPETAHLSALCSNVPTWTTTSLVQKDFFGASDTQLAFPDQLFGQPFFLQAANINGQGTMFDPTDVHVPINWQMDFWEDQAQAQKCTIQSPVTIYLLNPSAPVPLTSMAKARPKPSSKISADPIAARTDGAPRPPGPMGVIAALQSTDYFLGEFKEPVNFPPSSLNPRELPSCALGSCNMSVMKDQKVDAPNVLSKRDRSIRNSVSGNNSYLTFNAL